MKHILPFLAAGVFLLSCSPVPKATSGGLPQKYDPTQLILNNVYHLDLLICQENANYPLKQDVKYYLKDSLITLIEKCTRFENQTLPVGMEKEGRKDVYIEIKNTRDTILNICINYKKQVKGHSYRLKSTGIYFSISENLPDFSYTAP